jgi:hypothetical protein
MPKAKSAFQNKRRSRVAQAFRPARRPSDSPEGLRYGNFETSSHGSLQAALQDLTALI